MQSIWGEHSETQRGKEREKAQLSPSTALGYSGRDPRPHSQSREETRLAEEAQAVRRLSHCEQTQVPVQDPLLCGFGPLSFSCSETSVLASLAGGLSLC